MTRPLRPTAALERLGRLTGVGHGQLGVDILGEAIDRVDPDNPAALIELFHALQGVLGARCDATLVVQRRPSPRPRETT